MRQFQLLSIIALIFPLLAGCQIPYLLKNSWHQTKILKSRTPIKEILEDSQVSEETKRKLRLVEQAKMFSESRLGLDKTGNYSSYVDLEREYVTWVVRGSKQFELEPHLWWFPITGHVPYKGYFTKQGALDEESRLKEKGLDTFVRGVTAYSTLGWFEDPVLNTMMKYSDYQLVNLIIHETVHTTVFIKDNVNFNERLATFVANKGAEIFFSGIEGGQEILQRARQIDFDGEVFSKFISEEIKLLKNWYSANKDKITEEQKATRLRDIQNRFQKYTIPQMKTGYFTGFHKRTLNNAILLSYDTYQSNFELFNQVFLKLGGDIPKFITYFKSIENSKTPEEEMKKFVESELIL